MLRLFELRDRLAQLQEQLQARQKGPDLLGEHGECLAIGRQQPVVVALLPDLQRRQDGGLMLDRER